MSSKIKKAISSRKKSVLPLKVKIEMLDRLRRGESFASISRAYNVNESTVRFIKKSEDKIRNSIASTSLTSKIVRDPAIEKMEAALSLWIEDCNKKKVHLTGPLIREKAKRFYANFKELGDREHDGEFRASEGWLNKFKLRQSMNNVKIAEETAFADTTAAELYIKEFSSIITEGEYKPEQVFNADETVLFWKRLPNKKFLSEHKKSTKIMTAKDRATLLLCSNASGDCIIKPLMVYTSLNPRALKHQDKDSLPVFWRANEKALVTSSIFCDWFWNCFVPEVEAYLTKNNLEFNVLLVLDNAAGHPRELEIKHPNIRIIFLPPNTATFLQPMYQGIFQAFKLYYIRLFFKNILEAIEYVPDLNVKQYWKKMDIAKCIVNVKESLEDLKPHTLKSSWNKLWPIQTDENQEESIEIQTLIVNIVEAANRIGRDGFEQIEANDVQELIELQDGDMTENDSEEMLTPNSIQENSLVTTENLSFKVLNLPKGLLMANELCNFFIKNDPSMDRSLAFKKQIDNAIAHYRSEFRDFWKIVKL